MCGVEWAVAKENKKNKKLMVESDKSSIVKIHTINKF